jgi:hypothetical protein
VPLTAARISDLPSYRGIPLDELIPEIRRNYQVALRGLRQRRRPRPDEEVSAYEDSGAQRALQGVTLADFLHGWTLGLEVARAGAYRHAPEGEHREALLLEAIELMIAWNTHGMNAAAAAHRRVEMQLARQEHHDVASVVRNVLFGHTGSRHLGELERFGIERGREYYAVRVRPEEMFALGEVERWLGTSSSAARPNGLVALIDGDVAGFVARRPPERAVPVSGGLAGPVPLPKLPDAFRVASRALHAACSLGRPGLVDLPALGLIPSVLEDEDVGIGLLERYVAPLERDGRSGALVLETVECYLRSDCQVHPTATRLGVHPNTVRYRVGRFEALTGASLKHTESLVEAWWALQRRASCEPSSRPR